MDFDDSQKPPENARYPNEIVYTYAYGEWVSV